MNPTKPRARRSTRSAAGRRHVLGGARLALAIMALALPRPAGAQVDGALDPRFWGDGRFVLAGASSLYGIWLHDLESGPDGRLVLLTAEQSSDSTVYAWRPVGDAAQGSPCIVQLPGIDELWARALTFDRDGRLLMAGFATSPGGLQIAWAARYLYPSCTLDASFGGGDGWRLYEWLEQFDHLRFEHLALDAAGRILLAGYGADVGAESLGIVFRLTADGSPDPAFSLDGRSIAPSAGSAAVALAVAPDGRVALGALANGAGFRLESFGADGTHLESVLVPIDIGDASVNVLRALTVAPGGRLIAAGDAILASDSTRAAVVALRWVTGEPLAPDTDFGGGDGRVDFGFAAPWSFLRDAFAQGDGGILLAGAARSSTSSAFAIARLRPDGSLDTAFFPTPITHGLRLVNFAEGGEHDEASRLVLQHGRVVVAGRLQVAGNGPRIGVARLHNRYLFADGLEVGGPSAWSSVLP